MKKGKEEENPIQEGREYYNKNIHAYYSHPKKTSLPFLQPQPAQM